MVLARFREIAWAFFIFIIRLHLLPLFLVWHSPSLSPSFSPSFSLQQTHCERKITVICHMREMKTERMRGRDGGWGNERGGGGRNEKERERRERITFPFSPLSLISVCHEKWRGRCFTQTSSSMVVSSLRFHQITCHCNNYNSGWLPCSFSMCVS